MFEENKPKTDVKVKLVGEDGNAFAIIGRVSKALRNGGHSDLVKEFQDKAMSQKSYNDLLMVVLEYVDEEDSDDGKDN